MKTFEKLLLRSIDVFDAVSEKSVSHYTYGGCHVVDCERVLRSRLKPCLLDVLLLQLLRAVIVGFAVCFAFVASAYKQTKSQRRANKTVFSRKRDKTSITGDAE